MGLGDLWNRTLVYFGIAEEYDEAWDDDGYITEEELEQTYAERPSANVRLLPPIGALDRSPVIAIFALYAARFLINRVLIDHLH